MDNQEAIEKLKELLFMTGYNEALHLAIKAIKNERPHGEWINLNPEARGYAEFFKCSNCFERVHTSYFMRECEFDYCPNCGADMRGRQ